MLRAHKHSIQEVAIACGFNDQTNMTRAFTQELKITPYKYLKSSAKSGALPSPRKV
jgi:AraC-like DNA-binding protein